MKKNRKNKDFIKIYGFHAVQAALNNNLRKHQKLVISQKNHDFISKNVEEKINNIITLTNRDFIRIYGNKNNHQGIILKTTNLEQPSIKEIIKKSNNKTKNVIIMLDQITDPQNIGSIMRSCALFNCNTILVSKNNSPNITSSMAKTASGALEIVKYIKVTNLSRTIQKFKKNNFWIIGFDNLTNYSNNMTKLPKKCLLVFGAEGKGLRNLTKKECDQIIKIPINSDNQYGIESLNVANACTIALYEHFKINN